MCFAYDIVDHSFVLETSCCKKREQQGDDYI